MRNAGEGDLHTGNEAELRGHPAAVAKRYRAFLSYSRRDDLDARWLHSALESYRTPKDLMSAPGAWGEVPGRLTPIFRDRTDLSSGGVLHEKLVHALDDAEFLVVLCSPASAQSAYVNAEVERFVSQGRASHVMPVIVSGEPNSGDPATECFPPAMRPLELLASDLRDIKLKTGQRVGDGKESGKFKLIAGMLGVPLDALLQRERKRQAFRAAVSTALSGVFLALATAAAVAGYVAYQNELEARRQTAAAEASADFLVSTFEIAIPAQENPDTITARTILDRGARRIENEFARQPAIKARLIDAMARAYSHLGLLEQARNVIEADLETVRATGADGVQALLTLAFAYRQMGDMERALALVQEADRQLKADQRERPDLRGYVQEARAAIHYDQGQPDEALRLYDSALREYQSAPDANLLDVARVLNNRGYALSDLGRYREAERALTRACEIYLATSGQNSVRHAQGLYALALNAYNGEEYGAAAAYLGRAQPILTAILEPHNPMLGEALALDAQIRIERRDYAVARERLQQAISVYRAAYGEINISIGFAQYFLSSIALAQQDYALALTEIDRAKPHYDSIYDTEHPNQGDLLVQRAVALNGLGRADEAQRECRLGLDIIERALGLESEMYRAGVARCQLGG